jgi:hypothetical protein
MRGKTIDAYARAVRRVATYFDRCPDNLTLEELKAYFCYRRRKTAAICRGS